MTFKENSDYTDLKKVVLSSIVGTNERYNRLLSTIKEKYRNHINSPRRYEQIGSIGELLRVLEIRDVLSVNNVEPLKEIANELENSNVLLEKINEYERNNVAPEFVNYYGKFLFLLTLICFNLCVKKAYVSRVPTQFFFNTYIYYKHYLSQTL